MKITIIPSPVVVSSLGLAADSRYSGETFGLYVYGGRVNHHAYYQQHHTINKDGQGRTKDLFYLFKGQDKKWWIGKTLADLDYDGYVCSESDSRTPPENGWKCYAGRNLWKEDEQFSVRKNLLSKCGNITISGASKHPQCNGVYEATNDYSRGLLGKGQNN